MLSYLVSGAKVGLRGAHHSRLNRCTRLFAHFSSEANQASKGRKKLAYFGSDEFSVVILKHILTANQNNLSREDLVVLSTGKPENETGQGRKNDLVKFAEKEKLPVWIPISANTKEERIKQWRLFQARLDQYCKEKGMFDLGLVCSYGNLIPSYLIDYFQGVRC